MSPQFSGTSRHGSRVCPGASAPLGIHLQSLLATGLVKPLGPPVPVLEFDFVNPPPPEGPLPIAAAAVATMSHFEPWCDRGGGDQADIVSRSSLFTQLAQRTRLRGGGMPGQTRSGSVLPSPLAPAQPIHPITGGRPSRSWHRR